MKVVSLFFAFILFVSVAPAQHQHNYTVSGAGSSQFNGYYSANGTTPNGGLRWSNGSQYLVSDGIDDLWVLTSNANYSGEYPAYYYFSSGEPAPSSGWSVGSGSSPAPTTITSGPLPVQLVSFVGTATGTGTVQLSWTTISEINNYGFYVENKIEGADFSEVTGSFTPGHGTTNAPQRYSFTDHPLTAGPLSYRLKQVDLDGTIHYTEPIHVSVATGVTEHKPAEFALSQNYPNPFNPSTEIRFSVEKTGQTTLDVYNMLGQKVATLFDGVAEAGHNNVVRVNADQLASGMYFYRLQNGMQMAMKKMVLMK